MAKETKAQKDTIGRVMREAKTGALKTSAGKPVKSRRQAIAIALSEAGASSQATLSQKRKKTPARQG